MPAASLIDFDSVDLSNVVATREDLALYLKQRGRFAMLDGVLHEDVPGNLVVGYADIRADAWWASDHIPGRPIFPGALMIESAAQLATYDFVRNRNLVEPDAFLGFGGLGKTRFRGEVTPPSRMVFAACMRRARKTMFTYELQGFVDGRLVFESEVMGVVL